MLQRLLCLLVGYLCGCFLTAELVARARTGKSAAALGTGNPGMANLAHELGKGWGAVVLAGDIAKTALAFGLCRALFPALGGLSGLWAGLGAVLGHNFPLWRGFRGGKGVAVTCAALILFSPLWGTAACLAGLAVTLLSGWLPLGAVVIPALFVPPAFLCCGREAGLLALILARRTANRVVAPLNAVGSALQSVLDGTRASGLEEYQADDELRPILRYIDKLMERLGGYIQSITAERDKVGLILDCMDEGLILLDEAGNVLAINRAARTLFGFPEGEEDDGALLLTRSRRLREAIQESRVRHSSVVLDVDALTEDAQSLRLFISPVSGRQYEGQAVGTSILISDVTELKKAEGIRSEFTANVSHELKTPLTSIKGFTDMLASGMVASPEDQKRFITMIGVEVDRLIDLINDILKLSELESVTIPQSEERSDVLTIARDTAAFLTPTAKAAEVTLSVDGGPATVAVPQGRLKELLLNLVGNGIKYNEPGGTVHTAVSVRDGQAVIAVSDTGIGIPPEAQSRVFERFYRVDKGRARKNGGTGLGLAIVKHIVQLYGGTLTLESAVGKGSTFTVTLPLAKDNA